MHETAALALQGWEGFYVIVGTSAGALTGLQFVVLTLIRESGLVRGTGDTMAAFASPNVVHFCAALLLSAIMTAPWHGAGPAGVALVLCGVSGLLYSVSVLRRARRQRDYTPVLEDWIWHISLPILAYAALILAGLGLSQVPGATFVVGGVTMLLVFIGIHNAWDTVMYVLLDRAREGKAKSAATADASPPAPVVAEAGSDVDPAAPLEPRNP